MSESNKEIQRNIIYIFIDASNVWQAQKVKSKFLDYEKTVTYINKNFLATKIKVFYYTAYPANGTRSYDMASKHNYYIFLKKGLGFNVVKKELKRIRISSECGDTIKEKGNMDVEMTIDAVSQSAQFDIAIFFTGDSDFLALVSYLKKLNKKVYIFSSKNNISEELRTGSNGYVDILNIPDIWGRNLVKRLPND